MYSIRSMSAPQEVRLPTRPLRDVDVKDTMALGQSFTPWGLEMEIPVRNIRKGQDAFTSADNPSF